jgi:hypothetical protein
MACGVRDEELARRSRVAFQIKEHSIDMCLGMSIFAFGYRVGERGITIDKPKSIFRQFAEVVTDGFVRAMDRSIQGGIDDIHPIGFLHIRTGLNNSVLRDRKGIGEDLSQTLSQGEGERGIGSVGSGDTEISVGFGNR